MSEPRAWDDEQDEAAEQAFKPLTREQAQAWRASQPSMSPWRLVAAQAAVGVGVVVLAWALSSGPEVPWSALYGAVTIAVPSALMAWGITRRPTPAGASGAVGFLIWELAKLGLAVALLALAPWVLKPVSWPALLGAMVLCLKVNWVALLWGRTRKNV